MSVEQEIDRLEDLVKKAEDYASRGIWEPQRHQEMVDSIVRAEDIFNRVITEYVDRPDMPPLLQAYRVSDLQERLHDVKHNMPSPPPAEVDRSKVNGQKVVIYTTPT